MSITIQSIIDVLNQEYGHRRTPGWMYLIGGIVSIASTIAAKGLLEKRRALKSAKTEALEIQVLTARVFSQQKEGEIEYKGSLRKEGGGYNVIIEAISDGSASVVSSVKKDSLDEIEEYLRRKTSFILADFKE
jgi:hypothetical protein